jgi:hypothetical protein
MAHREIARAGFVYVGVSAQRVGVEGGLSLGADMSLKTLDPERYSNLSHPGDAFAYDIFSQVGRVVRQAGGNAVLGELNPEFALAVGESQSAVFLTTYINAVDPLAEVFDGFLVHSRFGPAAPLDGSSVLGPSGAETPQPVQFRPDLRVPVVTFITETDLIGTRLSGYHLARQPDNDRLRVWEVPGTAHADNYTIQVGFIDTGSTPLDEIVAAYAPTDTLMGQQLSHYINFAPQHHYVLQAAIERLYHWVRTGNPAPSAPRIVLSEASAPQPVPDRNGLAEGGVRTPWVDVPIAKTSGTGSDETVFSALFGSGELFDAATLRRLYPGGWRSTWSASRRPLIGRSRRDSSCRRTARRFSSSSRRPSRASAVGSPTASSTARLAVAITSTRSPAERTALCQARRNACRRPAKFRCLRPAR